MLKCDFHVLCGGSAEILENFRFWLVCIQFGNSVVKTRNPEAELQKLANFDSITNCMIAYQIQ